MKLPIGPPGIRSWRQHQRFQFLVLVFEDLAQQISLEMDMQAINGTG